MVKEIENFVQSCEFQELAKPVDMKALLEEDPELYEVLSQQIDVINYTVYEENFKKNMNSP